MTIRYGANTAIVFQTLEKAGVKEPSGLENWDPSFVRHVVKCFREVRFPTILALNKIDHKDADKNIQRICKKYPGEKVAPCSALAECFLKKLRSQGYILYEDGSDRIITSKDPEGSRLKTLDEKTEARVERIIDSILFRYGSTGVQDVVQRAIEMTGRIPQNSDEDNAVEKQEDERVATIVDTSVGLKDDAGEAE